MSLQTRLLRAIGLTGVSAGVCCWSLLATQVESHAAAPPRKVAARGAQPAAGQPLAIPPGMELPATPAKPPAVPSPLGAPRSSEPVDPDECPESSKDAKGDKSPKSSSSSTQTLDDREAQRMFRQERRRAWVFRRYAGSIDMQQKVPYPPLYHGQYYQRPWKPDWVHPLPPLPMRMDQGPLGASESVWQGPYQTQPAPAQTGPQDGPPADRQPGDAFPADPLPPEPQPVPPKRKPDPAPPEPNPPDSKSAPEPPSDRPEGTPGKSAAKPKNRPRW